MNRSAQFHSSLDRSNRSRRGFTLLEICFVLVIIALILGGVMPAIETAFSEKAVRDDTQQLALMVKTAMFRAAEQHRVYVIDVAPRTLSLHPQDMPAAGGDTDAASDQDDDSDTDAAPENVEITQQLNDANQLFLPDPNKPNAWIPVPTATPTTWVFQPGELCPVPRVHVARGDAWIEMSFNALTGNVEDETFNFP